MTDYKGISKSITAENSGSNLTMKNFVDFLGKAMESDHKPSVYAFPTYLQEKLAQAISEDILSNTREAEIVKSNPIAKLFNGISDTIKDNIKI